MKTHFNCDWCGKYIISDRALREHIIYDNAFTAVMSGKN